MSEWSKIALGKIIKVNNGKSSPPRLDGSKYPVWGSNGIIGYADQSNTSENSLIIGRVGSYCGSVYFSSVPCWITDNAIVGKHIEKISEAKFLYYLLIYYKLDKLRGGSGQPLINQSVLNQLEVIVPLIEEQKRIADVLSCLDAKIENLRQQNNTLEQIAQILFKHWFIDFEFPNTDGKPYKSSGGEMQSSVLGDIPKGWRVGKLGEYLNIKHGYAFKGEYITTEETDKILLTPVNFKIDGGFNDSKYKYYSDEYYPNEYILKKKDLTVTMTDLSKEGDTLGYPAFIPDVNGKVFLHNQRIGRIENDTIDKTFLYFLLCRREYRSHILGTASGSTVRHTSPSRICEYVFAIPDIQVIDKFSAIATVTIDKILINFNQIQTLTKTRDALLPKLMSGQIRIEE